MHAMAIGNGLAGSAVAQSMVDTFQPAGARELRLHGQTKITIDRPGLS